MRKKYIDISIIVIAAIILTTLGWFIFNSNRSPIDKVKAILEQNGVGQIRYSLKYDEDSKTILVDGDQVDKNGRDDYDYDNFSKSLPQLYKENLVHQFEYTKKDSVDSAGAIGLDLKIISGSSYRFSNETFYSWKWSKNDVGICSRNIKIIPQFAHITQDAADKIQNTLSVRQCELWNNLKNVKQLYK